MVLRLLTPAFIINVCVCITCRDYFALRQEKGIDDSLLLDDYKIIQLKSRIQYDDYNCLLKIYMLHILQRNSVYLTQSWYL